MKRDIFWNSLGTAAWSFLSLFLLIIVTRVNGIDDSGLFSFAFAIAIIMFTVGCYGGRAYQVSDHKNLYSTNDYISLRMITSLAIIVITLFFVTINGYDWYKSLLIFLLVGQRLFDAIADVFYGILQKKKHLYISGKSLFYKSILSFITFLVLDLITKNMLLSALSLPLISLLFLILYDIPQSRALEIFVLKSKNIAIEKMLKSTFLPFLVAIMGLVFVNLARYFIDVYHPNLQGYFGIIIMPLSIILLLFSFISTPVLLHMSEKYNSHEFHTLNRSIITIAVITFASTIILSFFMYFFGIQLLRLLFNIDFTNYIIDIVLVVYIGFSISLTSLFTNIAIIARKFRFTVGVSIFSNTLLVVLCIAFISQYEIRGAIIAYIIVSIAQAIIMGVYYLHLIAGYRLSIKS